ncbi:MAG: glycine--tRNA ligase [Candidatus Asgardarchaeia archaeon]
MNNKADLYEKVMMLSRRRGFIWGPSPEIYGGLSGFYDLGPLGKLLKNNVENLLRRWLTLNNFWEVEANTVSPIDVWIASGHVEGFVDPIVKCKKCGAVYRADKLIEEIKPKIRTAGLSFDKLSEIIKKENIRCPKCKGELSDIMEYNLMMKTTVGLEKECVLRPETATTTYVLFQRLYNYFREKMPISVFQIGKAYRNEISPRQGVLRLREFTQAEAQTFILPSQKEHFKKFDEIKDEIIPALPYRYQLDGIEDVKKFRIKDLINEEHIENEAFAWHLWAGYKFYEMIGIPKEKIRLRQQLPDERAHYARDAWDIEVLTQRFGWIEVCGVHDRGNYDLRRHQEYSKERLSVRTENGERVIPHVLEIAYGIERTLYALLEFSYREDSKRVWLDLPKFLAPIKLAVFPLMKKDNLPNKAKEVYMKLRNVFIAIYDEDGSIGKRYRRMDEVGTPFEVTIDYQTLEDDTVTVRDRNTMEQKRVKIDKLEEYLLNELKPPF